MKDTDLLIKTIKKRLNYTNKKYDGFEMSGYDKTFLHNMSILNRFKDYFVLSKDDRSTTMIVPIFWKGSGGAMILDTLYGNSKIISLDCYSAWSTVDIIKDLIKSNNPKDGDFGIALIKSLEEKIKEEKDIEFEETKTVIDMASRKISKEDRFEVLKRQKWRCNFCNLVLKFSINSDWEGKVAHIDHIHPFSERNTYVNGINNINELENLQALCPKCNLGKKDKKIN